VRDLHPPLLGHDIRFHWSENGQQFVLFSFGYLKLVERRHKILDQGIKVRATYIHSDVSPCSTILLLTMFPASLAFPLTELR